ncbi:MAG: L-sorbosone dehydrogenase [Monoraphidium minutum]|nr:MAG: L-sorbosone dehydrogenase [Monoraphidium minutum]
MTKEAAGGRPADLPQRSEARAPAAQRPAHLAVPAPAMRRTRARAPGAPFAAAAARLALLALLAARAAAQFGGADVPPEVAVRWSALDPKKWSYAKLDASMPMLKPPPGFKVDIYYKGGLIDNARSLAVSGNSKFPGGPIIVYVSSKLAKKVYALVDFNGDGTADRMTVIARGLDKPQGMDWHKGDLFVSGWQEALGVIWRLKNIDKYALEDKSYPVPPPDVVSRYLPTDRWHGERYMRFGPDGLLYVSIGAPCDVCLETKNAKGLVYSSIYTLNVSRGDGGWDLYARGLRNVVGMDWHPDTKELYFTENGRDNMGDNKPECELNRAEKRGLFFGFPQCHTEAGGDPHLRPVGPGFTLPDPKFNKDNSAMNCKDQKTYRRPLQALGPHIAPLGMRFYKWEQGKSWPREYDRTILIAEHGSVDRTSKIGYRLALVKIDGAASKAPRAVEHKEVVTGWLQGGKYAPKASQLTWGRPADVQQLPDGSLLISDDGGHTVYRMHYVGGQQG